MSTSFVSSQSVKSSTRCCRLAGPALRQWVLAAPKPMRYFLQRVSELRGAALHPFLRAAEQYIWAHGAGAGLAAWLGAVALFHRFGSSLNLHLHFHCVVIDGVFAPTPADGMLFHAATGPDASAIAQVQQSVRRQPFRVFVHRGLLPGDAVQAMGQWEHGGSFSIDAAVCIAVANRAAHERLLRYCARPPFGLKRLRELDAEHLLYGRHVASGRIRPAAPDAAAAALLARRPDAATARPLPQLLWRAGSLYASPAAVAATPRWNA